MKTVSAAILTVMLLVGLGACSSTDTKSDESQALTGPELAFFNEEFFNGEDFNIHNQFLSSLYAASKDIDLCALFYCGIPDGEISVAAAAPPSDEELRLVYGDVLPDCATYKLTTAEMDALLSQNTGLTVAGTNSVNLQNFTYLPEYDAYYFAHGDTNYRNSVTITAGEREGAMVRLYYDDTFMADGWKCVTLREVDGSYHFVSNQPSEKPTLPTVLPEGDPSLTISLNGLTSYQAPEVTVSRHTDDCAERLGGWTAGDYTICAYRSTDGNHYAAVVYEGVAGNGVMTVWDVGCFLTLPEEGAYSVTFFSDLFGHSGIVISYPGMRSAGQGTTFNDYYYVTDDGVPTLLARAYGTSELVDLDGDGVYELVSDTQLFFQRNKQVYEADLPPLLADAWPEMSFWDYAIWDTNGRYLIVRGFVTMPGWADGSAYFRRYVYFNGESLLVYKDSIVAVDHVLEGIDAPEDVLATAKSRALAVYQSIKNGVEGGLTDQNFNDWRITSLNRVNIESVLAQWPDLDVEVYGFGYQFHSAKPEAVGVAGGAYIDEDGWFGGFYTSESPYLVFQVRDGQRILLDSLIPGDASTDSLSFQEGLIRTLEQNGLLPRAKSSTRDSSASASKQARAVLDAVVANGTVVMTLTTANGVGGGRYGVMSEADNGPNRVSNFENSFDWSLAENELSSSAEPVHTLKVESPDGTAALQCWQNSVLVLCTQGGESFWLSADERYSDIISDGSIFSYLRFWYDEAEYSGLQGEIIIPDRGQSYQEIAQAWADASEGAMLRATPGSKYACTHVKTTASMVEDATDSWYPAAALETKHFYFGYRTVFVPENDKAKMWLMAGNTMEYEGNDAPTGALRYWLMGPMHLTKEGWQCLGVGTGP